MPRRVLPALPGDIPLHPPPGWQRSACGLLWRRKAAAPSGLALLLLAELRTRELPAPEVEVFFWPGRLYPFDLAWVDRGVAAEIQGATFANGKHNRGRGYESDCVKANAALLLGWRLLRFTTAMVEDGRAARAIAQALGQGR
jgi:hypothetical protein